jgi:hypothetical protein
MNPVEQAKQASDRFNAASRNFLKVKAEADRILAAANAEYEAAEENLRQYESQPGTLLPQYREQVTA